jgi:hypothetical protein
MVLEREREDPNDLEIRRLADRVRATLPNIQAVAEDSMEADGNDAVILSAAKDLLFEPRTSNLEP